MELLLDWSGLGEHITSNFLNRNPFWQKLHLEHTLQKMPDYRDGGNRSIPPWRHKGVGLITYVIILHALLITWASISLLPLAHSLREFLPELCNYRLVMPNNISRSSIL